MKKTIGSTEAARGLGRHLNDVLRGHTVTITRGGEEIADLVPCRPPGYHLTSAEGSLVRSLIRVINAMVETDQDGIAAVRHLKAEGFKATIDDHGIHVSRRKSDNPQSQGART